MAREVSHRITHQKAHQLRVARGRSSAVIPVDGKMATDTVATMEQAIVMKMNRWVGAH